MGNISFVLLLSFLMLSCNNGDDGNENEDLQENVERDDERPTEEDVKAAMQELHGVSGTGGDRAVIEFNSIEIGRTEKANLQKELQDVPVGSAVTNVTVNYTVTNPNVTTRESVIWMYKNELGEWKFITSKTSTEWSKMN